MALVRKANTELTVPEEKVSEYLAMGYSEINSKGEVVKAPTLETVEVFKARAEKAEKEVEKLKAELKKAKAEVEKLKKAKD